MPLWKRIWRVRFALTNEFLWGWRSIKRGRGAYFISVLSYRIAAATRGSPDVRAHHRFELHDGTIVWYRRDTGDMQTIREIFVEEMYRLPEGQIPSSLVDLGANIGLASVWLCKHYPIASVLAVEPIGENVALLRKNGADNSIALRVIEAAVGAQTGATTFQIGKQSNDGRLSDEGVTIPVIGIYDLLDDLEFETTLLKIDIEGGEGPLILDVDPSWIARFPVVLAEFHEDHVDVDELIRVVEGTGLHHYDRVSTRTGWILQARERLFLRDPMSTAR